MLVNDKKKLGMDSADPNKRSEWRGRIRGNCQISPTLDRGKQGFKMDMMIMMMMNCLSDFR